MRPRPLLLGVLILLLGGCAGIGPDTIRAGRNAYNVAIQQTSNEQLLLNIVRLKYRDTPTFLELTSVTSRLTWEASAEASATFQSDAETPYGVSGNLGIADSPTVSYTPLQGDKFVRQLLSPLDLGTIVLLYHSGWSIERLLRVCVQSANGVANAPTASGPTPDQEPEFRTFLHVVRVLRELQRRGVLQIGYRTGGEPAEVELEIAAQALDSPAVEELTRQLGLQRGRTSYRVNANVGARTGDAIGLVTRSLMGVLFYVSQGVEVPAEDQAAGRVTLTRAVDGAPFDWLEVTGDLLHVHAGRSRPAHAYVAVHYRDAWFFVADNDLESKSTFALLTQLFALQGGEVRSTGPVLTLPVGP
jgi:hypothetical protein